MSVRASFAAVLTAVLAASPAAAQERPASANSTAGGLAMSGGAGIGWTRPACDYCRRERAAGPVAFLQVTGQVNAAVALGAEARFWARDDEVFEFTGALGVAAWLFPSPGGPFHLKGGLAYLSYRAYDDDGDVVANMPALQLGAGYRFRISDAIALTNFVDIVTGRFGTLRSDDAVVVRNMGVTSLQLGLVLTRL